MVYLSVVPFFFVVSQHSAADYLQMVDEDEEEDMGGRKVPTPLV